MGTKKKVPPGKRLIFRAWITRNGKRVYASQYGLKGFPILVRR